MAHINLRDAEQARMEITKEQEREISQLYHSVYKELRKELKSLPQEGVSNSLRRSYLNQLTKQIKSSYNELSGDLANLVKSGMESASKSVVEGNNGWLKDVGLNIEGAYSRVPHDIVSLLSSGKLYGGGWSLNKAIWGDSKKKSHDIDQIVAAGVAANKSAYEIAKDLEVYVNPEAKKPWDWSKVYPGTSKKVDYNAQRLARTMVSHAYQQSLLATTKYNPFVKGYKWRSAHTHRTCEICNERDGKVYSAEDLPLDHPNGLCTFLVEIDDLDTVADRLGNWANGEKDPELDKWYQSMGGKPQRKVSSDDGIHDLPDREKILSIFTQEDLFDDYDPVAQGQVNSALYTKLGIGGVPQVVDSIPNNLETHYRGISNLDGNALKFFDQLKSGKLYTAASTSGNGINFANQGSPDRDFEMAKNFATANGRTQGLVVKSAFDKSMKLVSFQELEGLVSEFKSSDMKVQLVESTRSIGKSLQDRAFSAENSKEAKGLYDRGKYFLDLSSLLENDERGLVAVLNGFDGVESSTWDEYCIFNRTKLVVEKEAQEV